MSSPAYPRRPVASSLLQRVEYQSLAERMARDVDSLGANHRTDQDVESLADGIEAYDAPEITGTTGYEAALRASGASEAPEAAPDTSSASTSPYERPARTRTAPGAALTVGMPEDVDAVDVGGAAREDSTPRRVPFGQPAIIEGPEEAPAEQDGSFTLGGPGRQPGVPAVGSGGVTGPPSAAGEIEAYIRSAAARRGIDPEIAVRVAMSEGGVTDPVRQSDVINRDTGQREPSFGPFQLYLGGGLGNAALAQGIDPRNPAQWRQSIDFALDNARSSGWGQWHGAARVGIGNQQGIGTYTGPVPEAPATRAPAASGGAAPAWGTYTKESLTPNQFTEGQQQGLSTAEALAVCGPAAAVAFSRANGRNPTLREAKELAASLGLWDVGAGMHGPASQVQLLEKMGVPSRLAEGADWGAIAREVQAGRPVIVDTPQHYFTVTGYDPASGQFEFGQSAGVLKASGGRTRYRPEEVASLGMGAPRATIYMGRGG